MDPLVDRDQLGVRLTGELPGPPIALPRLAGERQELKASLRNLAVAMTQISTFVAENRELPFDERAAGSSWWTFTSKATAYVFKPFGSGANNILEHAGMRLDIRTRRVEVDGRIQELTNREYSLLEMLLRNKGETISREQLLESVWGMDFDPGSNIVNVYIRSLRRKIGENKVQTVRGVGYRVE